MSQVVSARLADKTAKRLEKLARRLGKSANEVGAMLIEESLREVEFAYIEFRNSVIRRQPYLKNSNLAVWQVILVAQDYGMDEEKVAIHFKKPREWVRDAIKYAKAYPEEIRAAIEDYHAMNYTTLQHILPQIELVSIPKEVFTEE